MANRLPSLRESIEQIAQGEYKQEPRGALASVLGNPAVKTVLAPLQALAIPGKVVVGGLREAVDAIDNDPNTGASFSEFRKNIADPKFGFGTAFKPNTGSKWLDRGIGFIGDVALDPLTYATFGVGKFAGYAGRLDMAEKVLKLTGDAALAARVSRYGRGASGMTSEILEGIGANRYGVYFLGKRIKVGAQQQGLRLPGSSAIGQVGDRLLSRLRVSASGTKLGKFVQKITLPSDNLAARQALAQGAVQSPEAQGLLVAYFAARPKERIAFGEALARNELEVTKLAEAEALQNLDGYRNVLHRYIEMPDDPTNVDTSVLRARGVWQQWFDAKFKEVNDALQAVDPVSEVPYRQNYFPRIKTDEAIRYDSDLAQQWAASNRTLQSRDPLGGGNNFLMRTMEEGDEFFGKRLTAEDLKSIDNLNAIARNGGFEGNYFETDVLTVAKKYAREHAREMALIAKHKHLVDAGFWKKADDVMMGEYILDKELIDSVRKSVRAVTGEMDEAAKAVARAMADMTDVLNTSLTTAEGSLKGALDRVARVAGDLAAFRAADDLLAGGIGNGADQLMVAAERIGDLKNKLLSMFDAKIVDGKIVFNQYDTGANLVFRGLLEELDSSAKEIWDIGVRMREESQIVEGIGQAFEEAQKAVKRLDQKMKRQQERLEKMLEFGNQLEEAVAAVSAGTRDTSAYMPEVKAVLALTGIKVGGVGGNVPEQVRRVFASKKNIRASLRSLMGIPDGTYRGLTKSSKVARASIEEMNEARFIESIGGMVMGTKDIQDVRVAGLWALLYDEHIFGGNIPPALQGLREKLLKKMEDADLVVAGRNRAMKAGGKGGRARGLTLENEAWRDTVNRAIADVEYADELTGFMELINAQGVASVIPTKVLEDGRVVVNLEKLPVDRFDFLEEIVPSVTDAHRIAANATAKSPDDVVEQLPEIVLTPEEFVNRIATLEQTTRARIADPEQGYTVGWGKGESRLSVNDIVERHREYTNVAGSVRKATSSISKKRARVDSMQKRYRAQIRINNMKEELANLRKSSITQGRSAKIASIKEQISTLNEELATWRRSPKSQERTDAILSLRDKVNDLNDDLNIWQSMNTQEQKAAAIGRMKQKIAMAKKRQSDDGLLPIPEKQMSNFVYEMDFARRELQSTIRIGQAEIESGAAKLEKLGVPSRDILTDERFNGSVDVLSRELSEMIMQYHVVGEVVRRHTATAELMSSFGAPPSKAVFAHIIDAVKNKYVGILETQTGNVAQANVLMVQLEKRVSDRIIAGGRKTLSPGKIFLDEIGKFSAQERSLLSSVYGGVAFSGVDPFDLKQGLRVARRGLASGSKEWRQATNEYLRSNVQPWFEQSFPGTTPTLGKMSDALNAMSPTGTSARSVQSQRFLTPASESINAESIALWFESKLGYSSMKTKNQFYSPEVGMRVVGSLAGRPTLSNIMRFEKRITSFLSPDVNIGRFYDDPFSRQQTPTFWASILKRRIDEIDEMVGNEAVQRSRIISQQENVAGKNAEIAAATAQAEEFRTFTGRTPEGNLRRPPQDIRTRVAARRAKIDKYQSAVKRRDELGLSVNALKKERTDLAKKKRAGLNKKEQARYDKLPALIKETEKKFKAAQGELASAPKPTAKEMAEFGGPKSSMYDRARSTLREYNERMNSPSQAKALNDQKIVDALQALAHMDLSQFNNGFMMADGNYAVLANGQRIVFTPEEWASLYLARSAKRGSAPTAIDDVSVRLKRQVYSEFPRKMKELKSRLPGLQERRAMIEGRLSQAYSYESPLGVLGVEAQKKLSVASMNKGQKLAVAKLEKQLSEVVEEISSIETAIANAVKENEEAIAVLRSSDDTVFASAMLKFRDLVLGRSKNSPQAPTLDGDSLASFLKGEHPAFKDMETRATESVRGETPGRGISELKEEKTTRATYSQELDLFATNLSNGVVEIDGRAVPVSQAIPGRVRIPVRGMDAKTNTIRVGKKTIEINSVEELEQIINTASMRNTEKLDAVNSELSVIRRAEEARSASTSRQRKSVVKQRVIGSVPPNVAERRKRVLASVWEESDEYRWLQRNAELEEDMFVSMYIDRVKNVEALIAERDNMQKILDDYLAEASFAPGEVDFLSRMSIRVGIPGAYDAAQQATKALEENMGIVFPVTGDVATKRISEIVDTIAQKKAERSRLLVEMRAPVDGRTTFSEETWKKVKQTEKEIGDLYNEWDSLKPQVNRTVDQMPLESTDALRQYADQIEQVVGSPGGKIIEDTRNMPSTPEDVLFNMDSPDLPSAFARQGREMIATAQERQKAGAAAEAWKNARDGGKAAAKANAERGEKQALEIANRYNDMTTVVGALREMKGKAMADMAAAVGLPLSSVYEGAAVMGVDAGEFLQRIGISSASALENTSAALKDRIDAWKYIAQSSPQDAAKSIAKILKKKKLTPEDKNRIGVAIGHLRTWLEDSQRLIDDGMAAGALTADDEMYQKWMSAVHSVKIAENELTILEMTKHRELLNLATAEMPVWKQNVVSVLADNWEKAAKEAGLISAAERTLKQEGMLGLVGNKEALDLLKNVERINSPGVLDDLAKFMRGYTGFFRAYATLSPGFHVRNSISNVFSMFSGGVDIKNMNEGFRLWRMWDNASRQGMTTDQWIQTLPQASRDFARQAAQIVGGLGETRVDDALRGFTRKGSPVSDNWLLDKNRNFGSRHDNAARFIMAYDALVKGMDTNEAFNRVKRFLIDYQEKTVLDNAMRDIVPFWTWMSRNLPLQIVNRWANPKPYLVYEKFVRNFSQQEEGEVVPGWLKQRGAINLGGGTFINPDLPFTDVERQIDDLTNPSKLMSYVNPGIRVPMEMISNRKFFTGADFKDKFVPLTGPNAFLVPMMQAAGQVEYADDGTPMAREKAYYAVMNLVPFLGKIDRLAPTTEQGRDKLGNSLMSFLGVPVTNVSPDMQDAERWRRLKQLQDLENRRKQLEGQ